MMASVIVCNGSETNKNRAGLAVRFANTAPRENAGSTGMAQAVRPGGLRWTKWH
jgi:hypothetical protein